MFFSGRSLSIKSAGLVGRNGPQSKQPFLVAFFKASGVLLRSVRAAGGKKKNHSRNKSTNQQETSRAPKPGGTVNHSSWAQQSSDFSWLVHNSVSFLFGLSLSWDISSCLLMKCSRFGFWFYFFSQITTQANRSKPARNMNFMSVFETWAGRWDKNPN